MTRSHSMRLTSAIAASTVLCAGTPIGSATAAPASPPVPIGPGHAVVMDTRTAELLSITSDRPLSDAVVKQFQALPGVKTYTQDVRTGSVLSITRS